MSNVTEKMMHHNNLLKTQYLDSTLLLLSYWYKLINLIGSTVI